MRIGSRIAQIFIDPIDEQIADRVLHVLGLFVHFVPSQIERAHQKQLNQPMPPHDSQRQRSSGRRQFRPVMRRVLGQIALAKRLQHAGDGAGRYPQRRGQLPRRRRFTPLLDADLVNCLDVIFDR